MKTTHKQAIFSSLLFSSLLFSSLLFSPAYSSNIDFLNALCGLEIASHSIQSIPSLPTSIKAQASTTLALTKAKAYTLASDPAIMNNIGTVNKFLNAQIGIQPNAQTAASSIPSDLLKKATILYSLITNASLSSQGNLDATGVNVIALINVLDQLELAWGYTLPAPPSTLTNIASGNSGAWVYTAGTATPAKLQAIMNYITAYIAQITQQKALSSFDMSAAPTGIATTSNNLYVVKGDTISAITKNANGTLSSSDTTITTPSSGTQALLGNNGTLWFAEKNTKKIGKLTTTGTPAMSEISLGGGEIITLTINSDGSGSLAAPGFTATTFNGSWYTPGTVDTPGAPGGPGGAPLRTTRTTASGSTSVSITINGTSYTFSIGADPTTGGFNVNKPNSTTVFVSPNDSCTYTIPFTSTITSNLLIGPDNRLWFGTLNSNTNAVSLCALNTNSNAINTYSFDASYGSITSITNSPDGASLWIANTTGYLINTDASVSGLRLANQNQQTNCIIVGPDNNLWVGLNNNNIKVIKATDASQVKNYTTKAAPQQMLMDSNKTIWFTEPGYIGRISPEGYLVEIPTPTTGLTYLAQAQDGSIWATDAAASKL